MHILANSSHNVRLICLPWISSANQAKAFIIHSLWYIMFLYCSFHYTELMFLYCAWRCSCTNRLMLVPSYENQHAKLKLEHFQFSDQHNGLCGNYRYVYNLELVMSSFVLTGVVLGFYPIQVFCFLSFFLTCYWSL